MQKLVVTCGMLLLLISVNTHAVDTSAGDRSGKKNCPALIDQLVQSTKLDTNVKSVQTDAQAEQILNFLAANMESLKTESGQEQVLNQIRAKINADTSSFRSELLDERVATFRKMEGFGRELSQSVLKTKDELDALQTGNSIFGKIMRFVRREKAKHLDTLGDVFIEMEKRLTALADEAGQKSDIMRKDLGSLRILETELEFRSASAEKISVYLDQASKQMPESSVEKTIILQLKDLFDESVEIHQQNIASIEKVRKQGLLAIQLIKDGRKVIRTKTLPMIFDLRNQATVQSLLKASEGLQLAHQVVEEATQKLTVQSAIAIEAMTSKTVQYLSENTVLKPYQKEAHAKLTGAQKKLDDFHAKEKGLRQARIAQLKNHNSQERNENDNTERKLIATNLLVEPVTLGSQDTSSLLLDHKSPDVVPMAPIKEVEKSTPSKDKGN